MTIQQDSRSGAVPRSLRGTVLAAGLFSIAGNMLMLTGPLFMLQVYDRILPSGSIPTLAVLFALVCFLCVLFGLFDGLRGQLFSRIGFGLDQQLGTTVHRQWINGHLDADSAGKADVNDLKSVRQFLAGGGPPAFFDLPWVAIYLAVIFALHSHLGLLATIGVGLAVSLTAVQEFMTHRSAKSAGRAEREEAAHVQRAAEAVDALAAMGMVGNIVHAWQKLRQTALAHVQSVVSVGQILGSASKAVRLLVQSGMLALGALLAIEQEISAGTLIAASILAGRAMAPVDQVIANWRGFIRARIAAGRLKEALQGVSDSPAPLTLPRPAGTVSARGVVKLAPLPDGTGPSSTRPLLQGIDFDLSPGDGLGMIGPSGSGKSCLARILVGLWVPERGSIRLDGAPLAAWDRDRLGQYLGYLPQNVQLFPGTVGQNIARFEPDATSEDIIEAARLAGVHDIILSLPKGYETPIGNATAPLSGGQAQRIALARAVYRMPSLVVLDEPNAHLDADGEGALADCITALRRAGSTVVVIAHRPRAVAALNKMLILNEGRQVRFGDKDDVLPAPNSNIHVVSAVQ